MGVLEPLRGDVFLVAFDPSVGSEIKKTHPAVVLQNDAYNRYGSVTIVAAITSFRAEGTRLVTKVPVEAPEGGLKNDSVILLNQLRTVDKKRLQKKLGVLSPETMKKVDAALLIALGLIEHE